MPGGRGCARSRHTGPDLPGQVKLTRKSYLGTSEKVSAEQHYDVSDFGAPSSDSQLRETKSYSYDAHGWRVGLTDVKKDENGGPDKTNDYLYGYDPHRNVSQLLTENGAVRASYGYSAYGDTDKTETAELKSDADDGATDDKQYTDELSPLNPYRYSDKRYDSGSGQLDMGARRFGPSTGQFLQEDVLKDALGELGLSTDPLSGNRYSLAGGNPVSFVEVDGHMVQAESGYTAAKVTHGADTPRAEDGPTTGDGCSDGRCGTAEMPTAPSSGGGSTPDRSPSPAPSGRQAEAQACAQQIEGNVANCGHVGVPQGDKVRNIFTALDTFTTLTGVW